MTWDQGLLVAILERAMFSTTEIEMLCELTHHSLILMQLYILLYMWNFSCVPLLYNLHFLNMLSWPVV